MAIKSFSTGPTTLAHVERQADWSAIVHDRWWVTTDQILELEISWHERLDSVVWCQVALE